jgi:hypothetical protein
MFYITTVALDTFEPPEGYNVKLDETTKGARGERRFYVVTTPNSGPSGETVILDIFYNTYPIALETECSCHEFSNTGELCSHIMTVLKFYKAEWDERKNKVNQPQVWSGFGSAPSIWQPLKPAPKAETPALAPEAKDPGKLHPLKIGQGTFEPRPVEEVTEKYLARIGRYITSALEPEAVEKLKALRQRYRDPNWQHHHNNPGQ